LVVDIKELNTYMQCPLMWKLKYKDNLIPQKRFMVHEVFNQAIHQLFYYLFNQVQNNYYPSGYHVKQAWGRIWCPGRSMQQILSHLYSNGNKITYNPRFKERQGLDIGLRLREQYKEKPGVPILVGQTYTVPLGRHTVSGLIELVRIVDEEVELIDVRMSKRRAEQTQLKHDVELTAASFALRYLLKTKESYVQYLYLDTGAIYKSTRGTEDYKRLVKILDNFEKAIKHELIVPNLGGQCHTCSYRLHCLRKQWF